MSLHVTCAVVFSLFFLFIFTRSAVSSAGEIRHSCFVALPFNWTHLKGNGENRGCREGMTASILSNEKKSALCPC